MQRIVVKVGTSTLTDGKSQISLTRMADLVRQMAVLQEQGNEDILVSSGAIAAGREALGFIDLPKHIPKKQMLAAIGQPRLMAIYGQLFHIYDKTIAQVLLTRADLADRRRFLNARNTLDTLLRQKAIPKSGVLMTIVRGDSENIILRIANYENSGTPIQPTNNKLETKKKYLLSGQFTNSSVTIDDGAARALTHGSSLLPAGIVQVTGSFDRGDSIKVLDQRQKTIAVGMANYSNEDNYRIVGSKSSEIDAVLGYSFGDEVIHHNNLVLL